jgi:hypothetical protein
MFKVAGFETTGPSVSLFSGERYISKKRIEEIKAYTSAFQLASFVRNEKNLHKHNDCYPCGMFDLLLHIDSRISECECEPLDEDDNYYKCTCNLSPYFPIYVALVDNDWCYIHPDEKDHVERFMAGTDNPLYDLVHELRFNPQYGLDTEVQRAKVEQMEKKRKIDE